MDNEKFDKEYKQFIAGQEAKTDLSGLWKELEPNLPVQKRKRRFFVLFFGLILLGTSAILFSVLQENDQNLATSENSQELKLDQSQTKTYAEIKRSAEIKGNEEINTNEKIQANKEKLAIVEQGDEEIKIEEKAAEKSKTVETKKVIADVKESKYSVAQEGHLSFDSKAEEGNQKRYLGNFGMPKTGIRNSEVKGENGDTKLFDAKFNRPKLGFVSSLPFLVADQLDVFPIIPVILSTKSMSSDKQEDRKPTTKTGKSFLEVGGSYIIPSFKKDEQIVISSLGEKLNEHLDIAYGYQMSVGYKYKTRKGLVFGLGLSQTNIIEHFEIYDELETVESAYNPEAFKFLGDYIGADQLGVTTTTVEVFQRNQFKMLDLIPSIGFQTEGRLSFGLSVDGLINLNQSYEGVIVDEALNILRNGEVFEARKFARFTVGAKALLNYELTENFGINVHASYFQRRLNESVNESFNATHLNNVSVGMGVRYLMSSGN